MLYRIAVVIVFLVMVHFAQADGLLDGHPRASYRSVENIDAMASALRKHLSSQERYSYSRSWWKWDRLRCKYVDEGRTDENAVRILQAVFRGLILDWHEKLEAKNEGDLMYIFFSTNSGSKTARVTPDGKSLKRDHHGGGYHGGWGGAARMRIYGELVHQGLLSKQEQARFKRIVHQSLSRRFIDFKKGAQTANNHSFGNGGGVALAIKLFPDAPQAKEARQWLDRIWNHLADFRDWSEWNYYPYGPIFLHGVLDIAEATDRIESERRLIEGLGQRCIRFLHGGGVRGNPNSGVQVRRDLAPMYEDPWHTGYFNVETSSRDGHFWYRLAQHYRDPHFLWAAEQVALGGRPPNGDVPKAYEAAYKARFKWFIDNRIHPAVPGMHAEVAYLSEQKHKIHERLLLHSGVEPGKPFAAFFLYDKKDAHLDNVSGHLFEYSVDGYKLLHSSGKYNNVYSGNNLKGGGTGEESLDLFLVMHKRHPFPQHPDRDGDQRDFMRRGSIKYLPKLARAETSSAGDSFGAFAFDNYYGPGSRWIRRVVLASEGCLVVADEYKGATSLATDYNAGPVWHLAFVKEQSKLVQNRNWFVAPPIDTAWWQTQRKNVLLWMHDDGATDFGSLKQSNSQDATPNQTTFAYRPIQGGRTERFLSVLQPIGVEESARAPRIHTTISGANYVADLGQIKITINASGRWSVKR